jgi:hypothetical protein
MSIIFLGCVIGFVAWFLVRYLAAGFYGVLLLFIFSPDICPAIRQEHINAYGFYRMPSTARQPEFLHTEA